MSYNSYGDSSSSSGRWPPDQPYRGGASNQYPAAKYEQYDPARPYINLVSEQPQYSAQQGYQSHNNPNYSPVDQSQTGAQTQLAPQQYQQGGYSSQRQQGYGAQAETYPASGSGQTGGQSGGQPGSISAETPNLLTQLQTQLGGKVLGTDDPSQPNQYRAPAEA